MKSEETTTGEAMVVETQEELVLKLMNADLAVKKSQAELDNAQAYMTRAEGDRIYSELRMSGDPMWAAVGECGAKVAHGRMDLAIS